MKRICVYGGQYGSEGKGCAAEFIIKNWLTTEGQQGRLVVFGEQGPNSGHTCSRGKVSNIPASSFFADYVVLGPDSAIDIPKLCEDVALVRSAGNPDLVVYIHENAALVLDSNKEREADIVKRISSTGSGTGSARVDKNFNRYQSAVVRSAPMAMIPLPPQCYIINRFQYMAKIAEMESYNWIFECSQGVLLDNSWGFYPHVTSRTTLPRVAVERNGLGGYNWKYAGVFRTYPIRTGGPSGPTGEKEIQFEDLHVEPEIASVTKRKRRIFNFSGDDFALSCMLARPDVYMFTHGDYLFPRHAEMGEEAVTDRYYDWLQDLAFTDVDKPTFVSFEPGKFLRLNSFALNID